MKKLQLIIGLVLILTKVGVAQLSGTYTVGSGQDYTSITAAADIPACMIPQGDSCRTTSPFSPTLQGLVSDTLRIVSNDPDEQLVKINPSGNRVNPEIKLSNTDDYTLVTNNFNYINVGELSNPSFTDLDGDGLLDLIIGELDGNLNHYEQDAVNSPSFSFVTSSFNSIDVGYKSAPSFTDLDGDGLLDLIIGERAGNLNHYEQDAVNSTSFSYVPSSINSIDVGYASKPTFTDIDDDGLLDLIIGVDSHVIYHYKQYAINSTLFSYVTNNFNSIDIGQFSAPTFTDIDGDGLLDLIIGELLCTLNHYKQETINSTSFSFVSDNFNSIDVGFHPTPTFTDIDGDNLLDLMIGEEYGTISYYKRERIDSLDFGSLLAGKTTLPKNYLVEATELSAKLIVECPEGFTVSLTEESGYEQQLSIIPVSGEVSDTLFVRFEPDSLKTYSGDIIHLSSGAETKNITVTGIGVEIDHFPGTALAFDGYNEHVIIPDNPSLDIETNITIETWIKAESWQTNYWEGSIICKDGVGQSGYLLRCGDNGRLSFAIGTGIWDDLITDSEDALLLNTWYHVAATYDGFTQKIYVNGELIKERITNGNILSNNNELMFGMSPNYPNRTFNGLIEEVRLWNVACDSVQIRKNMHLPLSGFESGLVAYWQFNEGSGLETFDNVSGKTGTLSNMDDDDWVASTIPFGDGFFNSQTEIAGTVDFPGTGLAAFFNSQAGAPITVCRIDTTPNNNPGHIGTTFDAQYWLVNRYGSGTFDVDLTFTIDEDLTIDDQSDPESIALYGRECNSDGDWNFISYAVNIDPANDKATFEGISSFGQFIICSSKPEAYAGTALQFDGTDDYVDLANQNGFEFTNQFTLEFWVYPDSVDDYNEYCIISKEDNWFVSIYFADSDCDVVFFSPICGSLYFLIDSDMLYDQWNHFAFIYDARIEENSTIKFYLNGVLKANEEADGNGNNPDGSANIGRNFGDYPDYFQGKMDELRFWNVARSETEIRENMHHPLSSVETSLVSYFQFNDGAGSTLMDIRKINNGTLTNMTEDDWIDSSIPSGGGISNTQTELAGTVNFPGTGFAAFFNSQAGASITVSRIDTYPNINPLFITTTFDAQYWVVNRYGSGTFDVDLNFTIDEDLTIDDQSNPESIALFGRESNSDGNWSFISYAVNIDPANDKATFEGISSFGQFIICSSKPEAYAGNALEFDGVDDYVETTLNNLGGSAITIEYWFKGTSTHSSVRQQDGSIGYIVAGWQDLHILSNDGRTAGISVGNGAEDGNWHHIAMTWQQNTTNGFKSYLDGELVEERTSSDTPLPNIDGNVFLGSLNGHSEFINGTLDEIRIWDAARSENQIRENMHRTLSGNESGLIGYWQFNESSGDITRDTKMKNHGTLQNMDNSNWLSSGAIWKRWEAAAKNETWSNTENWSTTFSAPTTNDMVLISSAGTQPVITNEPGSPAVCKDLKIESGATLTLGAGKALTVSDSILNEAGTSGLVLKSIETATASLIHKSAEVDAIVERYIPKYVGGAGWHNLSSPVATQPIQPGFVPNENPIPGSNDFYKFDEIQNLWINTKDDFGNWNSNFEDDFVVGCGYNVAYADNENKAFAGELNVGDFTFNDLSSPAISYTAGKGEGWNLMGNPYPSALDWNQCIRNQIDAVVYTYDGAAGQYKSWNGSEGALTDGIIPPMNGFFIKASSGASLTIPNSTRVHTAHNFYKEKEYVEDLLVLKVDGNSFSDKTYIHFNGSATIDFDSEFDAYKLTGIYEAPQLYTKTGDSKLSINVLPNTSDEIIIPLALKVGKKHSTKSP